MKRGYSFRKCTNCKAVFVFPQPSLEELNDIYKTSEGYFATACTNLKLASPLESQQLHDTLLKFVSGSDRFLDVGCSSGKLIYFLRVLGWQVFGCDVNEGAIEIAKKNGLDVRLATLESANYSNQSFDVINMGDVLEHLKSPEKTLKLAHELLSKKGLIVIRVPNVRSSFSIMTLWLSRITKLPWVHSEAPYHLFEFSPIGVTKLLDKCEFAIESIEVSGQAGFMYTVGAAGWFDELKKKLKRSGKYKINTELLPYLPKLIIAVILLFPLHLVSLITDAYRRSGHTVMVIARKKMEHS